MPLGLKDRVAVVTGGTGGIGKGIARRLAADGVKVVIAGRTREQGEALVAEIETAGGTAIFVQADVLVWEDMLRLRDGALSAYGRIDICVASGGGGHRPTIEGDFKAMGYFYENVARDVAQAVADATLAKIAPARAMVDHMIERGSGSILFITSEGGRFPTPGQTAVSLYSGGLIAMTKTVAKELSRYKIRVNTIAVTLVQDTPSWHDFLGGQTNRISNQKKILDRAPFGLASPADIAEVAAFLVSDSAQYITGATVSPTGGLTYS
jgi:3-oxoacyl-[acyl-carrier protein] reductase